MKLEPTARFQLTLCSNVLSIENTTYMPYPFSAQAVHLAAETGDLDVVGLLIQARHANVKATISGRGRTPLHITAVKGHAAMARFLLREGAPVSAVDVNLATPMHFAVALGSTAVVVEILAFLEQKDEDMVALDAALARGEHQGHTPLHIACIFGKLRCEVPGSESVGLVLSLSS